MSGYQYIGKDGKPVLARVLEDQRDAALARIVELEAERDATHAAGYRAGVEAAAEICAKHAGLPTGNDYENGWLRCACIVESEIRALLDSEAKP
jgi:exosome complex RNA-binding protein Csl4